MNEVIEQKQLSWHKKVGVANTYSLPGQTAPDAKAADFC